MNVNSFRKRVFADEINDFEMRISWINWVGPDPMANVLLRKEGTMRAAA